MRLSDVSISCVNYRGGPKRSLDVNAPVSAVVHLAKLVCYASSSYKDRSFFSTESMLCKGKIAPVL